MSAVYRIDLENHSGLVVAQFKDFVSLDFTIAWNDQGRYRLDISGFDSRVNLFGDDFLVRVWMKDNAFGINWTNIFNGIHKRFVDGLADDGNLTFFSTGPSLEGIVEKAEIQYYSGSPQSSKNNMPLTTAMYEYVRENVGDLATVANGRRANHVNPITNAPDLATGPAWSGSRAGKRLLETLKGMSAFSREQGDPIDFRVNYLGGYAFQFEAGRLGVDRTATGIAGQRFNGAGNVPVVFGANYGNVSSMQSGENRQTASNRVFVLGQGNGIDRAFVVKQDNLSAVRSPIAIRESSYNATQTSQQSTLQATAEEKLKERLEEKFIDFSPLDAGQALFRDYFVGDYVTGETLRGERLNKQIIKAVISVKDGGSDIVSRRLEFADV